jgi:hypothetical protein
VKSNAHRRPAPFGWCWSAIAGLPGADQEVVIDDVKGALAVKTNPSFGHRRSRRPTPEQMILFAGTGGALTISAKDSGSHYGLN